MELRPVTDSKEWNTLAEGLGGGYRHLYEWNTMSAAFGNTTFTPLGMYENGKLVDLFPLHQNPAGNVATSPGCLSYSHLSSLIDHVQRSPEITSFALSTPLCSSHPALDSFTYLEMIAVLSLNHTGETYCKKLPTVRKNIARAYKNNLTVQTDSGLDNFYRFYTDMTQRNRTRIVFPRAWFEEIVRALGSRAVITTAYLNTIAIGSVLYFTTGSELYNYFTVIDYEHRSMQAGTLLFHALFCDAIARNIQRVNLGPDVVGSPTFEFKQRFGAVPVPIYHHQYFRNPLFRIRAKAVNFLRRIVLSNPALFSVLRKVVRT